MKTKEEIKQYRKEYYLKNKDKISKRNRQYQLKNKERLKEYDKQYQLKNKELCSKQHKKYYLKNKEIIYKQIKEYRLKNKDKISDRCKEYRQRPEVRLRTNFYRKNKHKNDLNFAIRMRLGNLLSLAFKRYSTTGKQTNSKSYGINWKAIIEHLKPFPENIKNYEIDHIIPLIRFDFNNPKHIKIAFAPENHQWLSKEENRWKHSKLIMPH